MKTFTRHIQERSLGDGLSEYFAHSDDNGALVRGVAPCGLAWRMRVTSERVVLADYNLDGTAHELRLREFGDETRWRVIGTNIVWDDRHA